MSKKDNTHYIFIAIAFVLLFLVWRYKNRVAPARETPSVQSVAQNPSAQAPQIIDKTELDPVTVQTQTKRRQALAAKEQLGISSMPIPINKKGQYALPVEVVIQKLWCRGGEYEGIKSAVMDFDKKSLLLSIESTTSSGAVASPIRLNLAQLSKGFRHTFKLKISPKTNDSLMIALCTDNKKLNKCSEYKPADYEKINSVQESNPKSRVKEDYVFLYHSVFIKDGNATTLGSLDFSNDYQNKVRSILENEKFEASTFDKTWKIASAVRSTPLDLRAGKLTLHIARNDPKCDLR